MTNLKRKEKVITIEWNRKQLQRKGSLDEEWLKMKRYEFRHIFSILFQITLPHNFIESQDLLDHRFQGSFMKSWRVVWNMEIQGDGLAPRLRLYWRFCCEYYCISNRISMIVPDSGIPGIRPSLWLNMSLWESWVVWETFNLATYIPWDSKGPSSYHSNFTFRKRKRLSKKEPR
jgi:hypothetical protein